MHPDFVAQSFNNLTDNTEVHGAPRLVLEHLPGVRSKIILPVNHVRVNLLGRPYRPVAQPRRHRPTGDAAGQQVRAARVPKGVEARALIVSPESLPSASTRRWVLVFMNRIPSIEAAVTPIGGDALSGRAQAQ